MNHVDEAIRKLGGTGKAALALGVSAPAVCRWRDKETVPPPHVVKMSELTGIPYHLLNQVFPKQ